MPVVNANTPVATVQVPVPTPVQSKQPTAPSVRPVPPPQPIRPKHSPLTFGGEHDKFGNRVQSVSAVILPWSPQPKRMSRPRRYAEGEQHLDEEKAFQDHLDKYPDDHNHRMVFADWLQERGDPRAEGYRAMGQLRKNAVQSRYSPTTTWLWGNKSNSSYAYEPSGALPDVWLKRVGNNHPTYGNDVNNTKNWRYHTSRRNAEDAAALAFAKIPRYIKTKLLTTKLSRKKVVVRYSRTTLTPAQKVKAKKVELIVLPSGVTGKSCGTCQYAKKHGAESDSLYCTNNQVHMNVKANWGCKLWDTKGVKRLSRKVIVISGR